MPSIVAHISDGEETGRGEAAGVYYLGDDQAQMLAGVESVAAAIEAGATRAELQTLLPPCGARNALDCALWELESRLARQPVWSLAGLPSPKPLLTTFTLPADEPAQIAEKIKRLGFAKAIKLKLEGDLDKDRERVSAVRASRPDVWLSVDANQGFTGKDLDGLARIAHDFSVSLIEQPVRRGNEAALDGWHPGVPVAADESILHLGELDDRADVFDVINLKLDKCGGLTEALAMAHSVRAMGKKVMVGNMGGATLAMAPGFVVGQLCDFVDLDGPFSLADDPLATEIYTDGSIFVPEAIWGSA
jgi:L-alanine-DL-glutamate epimerase-like enolase superfamily enzyme